MTEPGREARRLQERRMFVKRGLSEGTRPDRRDRTSLCVNESSLNRVSGVAASSICWSTCSPCPLQYAHLVQHPLLPRPNPVAPNARLADTSPHSDAASTQRSPASFAADPHRYRPSPRPEVRTVENHAGSIPRRISPCSDSVKTSPTILTWMIPSRWYNRRRYS